MKNLYFFALLAVSLSNYISAQPPEALKTLSSKPFSIGTTVEIQSKELSEKRTLNIYLPPGYKKDEKESFPVLYLLDGSANEDFIHIAGLVQFSNFPWVNMLPKSIVVGIANVDRKRDFSFPTTVVKDKKSFPTTGGSTKFISFLEKELQPYINQNYRTSSTRILIGQSFGGLLATQILFEKPSLFTHFIVISPSTWWDAGSLLERKPIFLEPDFDKNLSVYVGVGKEGDVMIGGAKKLFETLKKNQKIKASFKYFGENDHGNILHIAVYDAFETLFKNFAAKDK